MKTIFKIKGLGNIQAMPENFQNTKQMSLKLWAEFLKTEFQKTTPVDTGWLRQSYRTRASTDKVKIYNTKQYWLYIHDWTRPHRTSVKNLRKRSERHGISPYAVQRSIARKWTKGKKRIDETIKNKGEKMAEIVQNFILKNL